jgi:hypothetical protein
MLRRECLQGLKPPIVLSSNGTAKAVPLQNGVREVPLG